MAKVMKHGVNIVKWREGTAEVASPGKLPVKHELVRTHASLRKPKCGDNAHNSGSAGAGKLSVYERC